MNYLSQVGQWLHFVFGGDVPDEPVRVHQAMARAVVVYLAVRAVRNIIHGRVKKMRFWATIDNLGGGVAGLTRMLVVMAFLTILISLMRSPFWHEQVSKNSQFGSYIVSQFPAVAEVVKKEFPETLWFTKSIKRRQEPDVDNAGTASK